MSFKDDFLKTLSDEQLGFFCAHEYNEDLEQLLHDELNIKQFKLFEKWKENEADLGPSDTKVDNSATKKIFQKFESIAENLFKRMDAIEAKLEKVCSTQSCVEGKIDCLTETLENSKTQMSNIAKKIEEGQEPKMEKVTTTMDLLRNKKAAKDQLSLKEGVLLLVYLSKKLEDCPGEFKREQIGSKHTIKAVVDLMKKYESSDEIPYRGSAFLAKLTDVSLKTCRRFDQSCLGYLCELFRKNWPERARKEDMLINIFYVFQKVCNYSSIRRRVMQYQFLDLFLLPFSNSEFTKFDIISAYFLTTIITVRLDKRPFTMNKEELDKKILQSMEKFVLGRYSPLTIENFSIFLKPLLKKKYTRQDDIRSGKSFSAWILANQMMIHPTTDLEFLSNRGAIRILEKAMANKSGSTVRKPTTEEPIKKLMQITHKTLKLYEPLFNFRRY